MQSVGQDLLSVPTAPIGAPADRHGCGGAASYRPCVATATRPPAGGDVQSSDADDLAISATPPPREPPALLLVAIFTGIAIALTFPNLSRFHTFVAGDSGDSLLNLWIMRSVQAGFFHGWNRLWDPPIFYPAHNVLAYSDTLLPVALVHWPLRLLFGDVVAFNLIYLSSWVLSSWCVYRIARRVTTHWGAAFVAALAYTYAAIRLVHQQHFQLVVGGGLVALSVLLMLRMLDVPSRGRAIWFGVSLAATTLTASYYGTMMAVITVVVAGGWLVLQARPERRRTLVALGIAAIAAAVFVVPVGIQYVKLERDPAFRRGFEPASATHPGDLLATGSDNYVLRHVPVLSTHSETNSRGIENRLFPGFVAIGFGIAGAVILIGEIRRRGARRGRTRDLSLLCGAGVVCLVLSFGDYFRVDGHRIFLPFVLFRHLVPGFAGIRAVARFELGAQLALVLLAAVAIDALLAKVRSNAAAIGVTALLSLVVCAETAIGLTFVRVPTAADDGGVSNALRALPRGVVAELPMQSVARGVVWPYAESPRQLLALRDSDPRVNGYSGFQPKGFDAVASALDDFPSPSSIAEARKLGVRYIVLRTKVPGALTPPVSALPQLGADGALAYDPATARAMIERLPADAVSNVTALPGGYLVTLRP